jgi:hypothetical protein
MSLFSEKLFQMELLSLNLYSLFPKTFLSLNLIRIWVRLADEPSWHKGSIPVNIRNRRRPRHGRPYRLDLEAYKRLRSSVERFFTWLTNWFRRPAIRWEKPASTLTGLIQLACIMIYLRVFR